MRTRYILVLVLAMLLAPTLPDSSAQTQDPFSNSFGMTPIFGPKRYTRLSGQSQNFTETFEHRGTARCQIVVINGNDDGTKRVIGSIFLNGKQVVAPTDFNQRPSRIVKPVVPADQNQLTVALSGPSGNFMTVDVECADPAVNLTAGGPGVNLLNPTTLLAALPIVNTGIRDAQNVQVTAVTLFGGTLSSPSPLPFSLGTIQEEGTAVLDATFSGGPFTPGSSYPVTIQGTYVLAGVTNSFTLTENLVVPPAGPGSASVKTVTVAGTKVSGAPFTPQSPSFDDEVNGSRWTVPTAPFVPGTPTPTGTDVQTVPQTQNALREAAGTVVFLKNSGIGISGSTIAEPSGASNGAGVVFVTSNWFAAYSTNGGNSFTQINPTAIFPADIVGFCCDQIVQYVPSIDRFIWLLQGNGMRIASASPADIINSGGTAWTYWNLNPQVFGQPNGTGFDYPDLSVGNNSLYMSWDAGFGCPMGCRAGFQVTRTSLAGIQAGGTITIEFTDPPDSPMAWGSHLMQNTLDEIFWAGHNSNSNMRVFSLAEGSGTYFWRDVGISSWANNALSSTTPDSMNWLAGSGGFPGNAIIGATRSSSELWFAWNAGTDNNFRQPHVEIVTLGRNNNFNKIRQVQIWNNSYAFAYPALSTNACTGEVGLSLEYGGNGNYENHVVGLWGDFVVYITSGTNVGTTRFGDYVTLRREPATNANPGNLFSAFGYGLNSIPPPGSGSRSDIRYVLFGRPASSCQIIK